jgi:acyl carrier protein
MQDAVRLAWQGLSFGCLWRGRMRLNLPNTGLNERLIRLVKELLGPNAVVPDPFPIDRQLSELGLSSLKMVNLMLSVETEFDIMIPQSEITPENFHNLASIASLVERTLLPV